MGVQIWAKLSDFVSIKATYPANFIEITYMVQHMQHFKL